MFFLVCNVNYKVVVVLLFFGFGFVVYFNIWYNGIFWLVKMVFILLLYYMCSFVYEILFLKYYNFVFLCNSVFINIVGLILKFVLIYGFWWFEKFNIWKVCFRKLFGIFDWYKYLFDIILFLIWYICWLWLI